MIAGIRRNWAHLKEVAALVWQDATPFVKLRLACTLGLVVVVSALSALGPLALKEMIDELSGKQQGPMAGLSILVLVSFYILSQWFARTVNELRGLVYARAERRMSRTLSERLFSHIMRLPLQFHINRPTGAINQVLQNGLQGYHNVLNTLIFTMLPVTIELATIVFVLVLVDYPVFLGFFCAAVACYAVAFAVAAKTITTAARDASIAQIDANAQMTDVLLNYETVKYFTAEAEVQKKVSRAFVTVENCWVRFFRRYTLNGLGVAAIYATFLAFTILFAVREVQAGRMTVGTFVLINTYMLSVVRPVEAIGYAIQGLTQALAFLEKMLELFHEKAEPASVDGPAADENARPASIEVQDVSVGYLTGRMVLKGVSFKVGAGRTLGVVGSSGAGKSTMTRLLTRLIEPESGRVLIDGVPTGDLPLRELRASIAVVPQDTILFNDTIGNNIAFGKPGSTQQEIERAARLAHLHDFIMTLPQKYETNIGERGVKLSGGEKQRLSIARAAIKQPRIFIFDEATSSLDTATEREILGNLREISRLRTTIVIAHRLSTVVHADEIVVLEEGRIVERGTHASLLRSSGRYSELWMAQQEQPVAA